MEENETRGSLSRRRAIQIGGGTILAATATGAALETTAGSALASEVPYPPDLDERRRQIFAQFHRDDLHIHVRRINADKNARLTRSYPARVVRNNVRDDGTGEHYSMRPVKGSVLMFTAKRGHWLLPALERAYVSGDRAALQNLSRVIDEDVNRRNIVPVDAVVDMLIGAPAYFDLVYGEKLLTASVGLVNGLQFGSMLFPWNGGRLNTGDFTIVEYTKPSSAPDFETLLVLTEPDLTPVARAAVDAVPTDMLAINIGSTAVSPYICLVIVVAFAAATAIVGCASFQARLPGATLPDDVIKQLGNVNSAVELLNRRRQLFESFGI
jgi:hypothetical protein